jgi:hypothetical protein
MVTPMDFLRRNRLPAAVVFTLLALDFAAIAMVCLWGHEQSHKYSQLFPTRLYPFVHTGRSYDLNGTLLALACSQVSLLTLWVLNGRAAVEIRLGSLILGSATWVGMLHFFYGDGIPASSAGALFFGQIVTLFIAVTLFRRRLLPQDQPQVSPSPRRNIQFSIRTLLLATTLIAISIAGAPYIGIVIENPYASQMPDWPLVVNQWKLVLGTCSAVSALFSLLAIRGKPKQIPFRLVLACLTASFLVVALVWLAVVRDFFYPAFSTFSPIRWELYMDRHFYQPWVCWITIQIVIVSSVLLVFRWGKGRVNTSSSATLVAATSHPSAPSVPLREALL